MHSTLARPPTMLRAGRNSCPTRLPRQITMAPATPSPGVSRYWTRWEWTRYRMARRFCGPPRPGALNFPADRRVFVVLQGTDFIRPDATLTDLSLSGNDVALPAAFPYVAAPHLLP